MQEKPLYPTKEEALAAPGEIYQHYKGGVYRLVQRDVKHTETGEIGVLYEHPRSRIFTSPSLGKFRDPTSRFRQLAEHRCGFKMSEKAKQVAFSVAFRPHNHGFWFRPQDMFFGKNVGVRKCSALSQGRRRFGAEAGSRNFSAEKYA